MPEEQCRAAAGTADTGGSKGSVERSATAFAVQPERKYRRVLRALLSGSLNRFEATRPPVRDWCLPSTVSELEKRGLTIQRRSEAVPGAYGDVHCARYWVAPESRELAQQLLGLAP
jgi:hypothetical protein